MLPAGRQGCDASVRAMHASPQSEEKEPADGKRGPLGLTPPSRARGALLPWVAPTWRTLPCTRPLAARGGRLCRTLCAGVSAVRAEPVEHSELPRLPPALAALPTQFPAVPTPRCPWSGRHCPRHPDHSWGPRFLPSRLLTSLKLPPESAPSLPGSTRLSGRRNPHIWILLHPERCLPQHFSLIFVFWLECARCELNSWHLDKGHQALLTVICSAA